ncbi:MAG: SDR family NAD(P)-dependent oxidoreductase [Pseudomonadota bacterium]|nr:SDR family NAD(P)-dependent oxidoreductase [Pseudomonadota bacterium]
MKSVLVTGATDGIGRETARQLLELGLHVLVHGRSESKATAAAAALNAVSASANATPVWADFSRMREVVNMAEQVNALIPQLDILINNAGVYEKERRMSEDGFEMTMAVNHFASFLLTRRLLPAIESAPRGRIVMVSSMTHQGANLDPKDLELSHDWSAYGAYGTSKLANLLFTYSLAERMRSGETTANALHPGVVATKLLHAGFSKGGGSVQDGAATSVHLATSPKVEGLSGRYFVSCRENKPTRAARDGKLADAFWTASERALEKFL